MIICYIILANMHKSPWTLVIVQKPPFEKWQKPFEQNDFVLITHFVKFYYYYITFSLFYYY